MKRKRLIHMILYAIADYFSAMLAWALFFILRSKAEGRAIDASILDDNNFWYGIIVIPIGWLLLYWIFDKYKDIYRLSRLATLRRTFFLSIIGALFLFFTLILDDVVVHRSTYMASLLRLFFLHFIITSISRMTILTLASRKLKAGKITFNTIIVGGNEKAVDLYRDVSNRKKSLGHKFLGFVYANGNMSVPLEGYLPKIGGLADLSSIIEDLEVEEVIIAIETVDHDKLKYILDTLFDYSEQVLVKIIPDMYDILLGTVKMSYLYGAVLIEIEQGLMPKWEKLLKRLIDIVVSLLLLILLSPVYLYVSIRVILSSKGPIFFKQERVGLHGKPFHIHKFRSMHLDAEDKGPQLSFEGDDRCTPWGSTMRKWRLDELPQFWNVLIGEMSLVGPRPERQYYIDQIISKAPHYKHLLKVRPGITSWGQVKFGYASSVDQMIQRLKYDILYIENMSIGLDIKILFYTVLVLLQGKGK